MWRRRTFAPLLFLVMLLSESGERNQGVLCSAEEGAAEKHVRTEAGINASDLNRWLENWKQQQSNSTRPAIIMHPKYGLGNRILSVVSALGLALATERRLFIEWGEHFDSLFTPPYDWTAPPSLLTHPSSQVLDLSAHSPQLSASASTLACSALEAILPPSSFVLHIASDQFFLPLLLLNARAWPLFSAPRSNVGGSSTREEEGDESARREEEWKVAASLARWLFRPAEDVRRAVLAFTQQHRPLSHFCAVGVHVRVSMFAWEESQVPRVSEEVALQCTRQILLNSSSSSSASASDASSSCLGRGQEEGGAGEEEEGACAAGWGGVFVATTSEGVKRRAVEVFGKRVAVTRGVTERLTENGAGERQALMDLILLARCREIVGSVHSTFSYAAHLLGRVTPWIVTAASAREGEEEEQARAGGAGGARGAPGRRKRGGRGREGGRGGGGGSACVRAQDPAPCFHQWYKVARQLQCLTDLPELPPGMGGRGGAGGGDCWY